MAQEESTSLGMRVAKADVLAGTLAGWWLGGSGFIFKTATGQQVWIDPYLSDVVNTIFGVPRMGPPPIALADAAPDWVVSTHWHEDHLDPGFIPLLARLRPETRFIMPPSARARALSWGLNPARVTAL